MKRLIICLSFLFPVVALSQHVGKVWTELGVETNLNDRIDLGLEFTSRFDVNGLETFFPQLGVKYKINKYIRPSIDYRYIVDRMKNGQYSNSHRLNFNVDFKYKNKDLTLKSRVRYQYGFDNFSSNDQYDSDFDQAIRLKVGAGYDIPKFILSPVLSGELFYDPINGPTGRQFNKLRIYAGLETDFSGPHSIALGYIYDTRINMPVPLTRHILNISYSYTIERGADKKKK